ncbi:hypothetical protein PISMIDRAFT_215579 [Pisolithus microcarpus 441]|uniref:Uncharacterized protein n=1 Tax=Pisolithus microcarpus 441 TaxID=765257 RepID=A0A0C9ZCG3_9AGAM|nr:hypothetical protein PISMIDRAFT_215579 [Pisolithus microcarpus 441]
MRTSKRAVYTRRVQNERQFSVNIRPTVGQLPDFLSPLQPTCTIRIYLFIRAFSLVSTATRDHPLYT